MSMTKNEFKQEAALRIAASCARRYSPSYAYEIVEGTVKAATALAEEFEKQGGEFYDPGRVRWTSSVQPWANRK